MAGIAGVDDVEQEVGVLQLFQRGAERRHQILREIADEPDRVGDDHLAVAGKAQPPRGRIQSGEELVFGEDRRIGERIEQRALSGVGIADDGDHRDPGTVALAAPRRAVSGETDDARFQRGDPLAYPATIDLQLRLAGSATPDSTGEARERVVPSDQPRQQVLELRQFHLQLAVGALRSLREDVEDELCPIENAQRGGLADVARLRGSQIPIEHEQVGSERHRAHQDLLQLAFADQRAGIDLAARLQDHVEHLHVRGARQLLELLQRSLRRRPIAGMDADENGAPGDADGADRSDASHLLLQRCNLPLRVELQLVEAWSLGQVVQVARRVPRHQRRDVDLAREAVLAGDDGRDGVQPQQHEVRQVVPGERLVLEVRVHQAQATEARMAGAGAADVRQHELARVSHDHMLHLTPAVDEHAELSADFSRQFGEMAGQFGGNKLALLDPPAAGGEQALAVAGLESGCVSEKSVLHWSLVCNTREPLLHLDRRA